METSEITHTIETLHRDARERRLFFQQATDAALRGRKVTVNGKELLSFGSCSYLGLEFHPDLIAGACDATMRYGTQFSCSRGYLSAPPYAELEAAFDRIFEANVLVAPTTTLAHTAAFDALMSEKDAIVLDHQVHQSVHQAANLARVRGAHVEMVRHEELEKAIDVTARLARKFETVWFCTDGVLSMYGDLPSFPLLRHLLAIAPNVRLYVDDAHGMSWKGKHGRGCFLFNMPLSDRVVVATSLAKAFGCGGGLLVFSDPAERERVRMCGGTLLFSGPMQPPMLGAALASARLHLTPELPALQERLRERVLYTNRRMREERLPLLVENDVPIRFVRLGLPRVASEVAQRMTDDGLYVNVSMFPTVPMKRAGIRISVNANHEFDDIDRLITSLARHVTDVLDEERMSVADLDTLFAKAVASRIHVEEPGVARPIGPTRPHALPKPATTEANGRSWTEQTTARRELKIEHARTIHALDKREWDRLLGQGAMISADAMAMAEKVFTGQPRREHNWVFDYVIVRDEGGNPVCATVFTTALQKDDFIMRDAVSRAVEARREADPYFLTSLVVMSGTTLSEGRHVYVDRRGPWREGLRLLLDVAARIYERENADAVMLRDMPAEDDEMDAYMLDSGYVAVPMLDSHVLSLDFRDEDELATRLSKCKRQDLRKQARRAAHFRVDRYGAGSPERRAMSADDARVLHEMYKNLARRKFRINIFELPPNVIGAMLESTAWEIVTLTLDPAAGGPAHGRPVAWFAGHLCGGHYGALVAGLDYDYVLEHGVYRQMIFQVIRQAKTRGIDVVHLGMDADVEKSRYRTTIVKNCIYLHARENYNGAVLREIVAELGAATENGEAAPAENT
ncbi:bifunctional aminotransferase class I/II-fold pyridoxal phosphate-dependent enzyme/GNAT family N-acetyltransferase [Polyangium sp. y55x31]|uniref:bifunctional aminotransferase class I/II-fold pyridoxal phosphate-dependent enzyme/GNAT family N-acetyltransferase n=1 Tax=Polyangium sp. y55x31 TaxID=3042688 RepID=UPI002482AB20|nr:bifunctional aminotransferase class I/II-fold pyridoxal phosphate-dependent enzyme/GNAT family N-acetyltransferase [Polyangium sp. y55x31]MDI1476252.1 bifunctional aminotransferase class I/II-fold pyridoxal phosphate-dependent enzyme/GNAT family N-acetyltransferase [Polyangium sp. y55x31]